jgi:dienelactone hydrolase
MFEQMISWQVDGREYPGVLVGADGDRIAAGVLVLHGGTGPGENELRRARMLAEEGYVAFVPDLFGQRFTSREEGVAMIGSLVATPARLRERVSAALACLARQTSVDGRRLAAIGYCFGGLAALELARSGADVRTVVSFHGGLRAREPAREGAVRARVLVCTGARDPFVDREQRIEFEDEMTMAGAAWEIDLYAQAAHGFTEQATSRPGCGYDRDADHRSWSSMLTLFEETLQPA